MLLTTVHVLCDGLSSLFFGKPDMFFQHKIARHHSDEKKGGVMDLTLMRAVHILTKLA